VSFYKENEDRKIALIFSCPGRLEESRGRPCAGVTGKNLETLIAKLNESDPRTFPASRSGYFINNAWPRVEYREKTGRTEAAPSELLGDENLDRLRRELAGVRLIICFGLKAAAVIDALAGRNLLRPGTAVLRGRHLGMQSINRVKTGIDGRPIMKGEPGATQKRIAVIARGILEQR
jgi:hypothetical protein